ncbi:hypothetical protein [Azospirillum sp. B4]|uniref:hypothetical protein n=1 Tax=Azospirillum sp. B4 TaxID=95605 RepID=UPI00034A1D65|nr:hypothetical protein [Azospirillum sp. B4]
MSFLSIPTPTLLLRARLALGRIGWTTLLAGALFLAGASAFLIGLPALQARVEARQGALAQVTARAARAARQPPPAAAALPPAQRNLQAFYDALGDVRYADQDVAVILDEADRQGLTIAQAEYKLGYDKAGLYHVYTMQMPVTGSYAAIRDFLPAGAAFPALCRAGGGQRQARRHRQRRRRGPVAPGALPRRPGGL